jgi:ABC-type transport system substrate-binding protein
VSSFAHGNTLDGVHIYDRLVTVRSDKRRYNLEAAGNLEQSDPVTVVFKLKPGQVYQNKPPVNGRKLKASDIVDSQNYVKNLVNAENNSFQRLFLDHAEATDDETVVFHMQSGDAYLFSLAHLGFGTGQMIIPPELYDNLDKGLPVGSGPYEQADVNFNVRYLYRRFDKYHEASKKLPYIDEHEIFIMTDDVAREAAFRSGQINRWLPPASITERLQRELDPKQTVNRTFLASSNDGMNANMDPKYGAKPWHDVRVREAFYRLTDRAQIAQLVFTGQSVPTTSPTLHENLEEYLLDKKDVEPFTKKDVAAAKQLLSAANFDTSQEFEIICNAGTSVNAPMAEVWQQQLSEASVKVRVSNLPFAEWLPKRIASGDFDFIVCRQPGGDTPYRAMRNQHSDTLDQYNHIGLMNKTLDAMIEKSEHETDHEAQIKMVKDIQKEALKQYSLSYIYCTPNTTEFLSASLQDFELNPVSYPEYYATAWFSA